MPPPPQWTRSAVHRQIATLVVLVLVSLRSVATAIDPSKNYKISPKPCSAQGYEGTCMFVWECIKSEGQHIGMCVDSFMFGSCCAHNLTENVVLPQTISYVPSKPISVTKKPVYSNKPVVSSSGLTTIQRPNGSGMLVVRPNPVVTRPSRPTTAPNHQIFDSNPVHNSIIHEDLSAEASVSTGSWNNHNNFAQNTVQWQMTTQPNFITKPKPSGWDKPTPTRNKVKPTKTKPQIFQQKPHHSTPSRPSILSSSTSSYYQTPTKGYPTRTTNVPVTTTSRRTTTTTTSTTTTTTTTTTQRPTTTTTTVTRTRPSNPSSSSPFSSDVASSSLPQQTFPSKDDLTISAARGLACGTPTMVQRPQQRIVGGKNANFGRWPWQVSVRRTSFFGFSSTHRCGGAVLNENWIATAGHCVDDLLTNQIRIRVGEYDFSHVQEQLPYVERAVSKKIVHPKYNFFTYEYDLALVKLETPLEFTDHIAPICLPGTEDLLIGANATVTGWGRLSEGGTLPTVLQEVSVPIVSNDRCKAMFLRAGRHEFIPEIFLCAGHETGGQDSCQGDSGGPLQVKADNGQYFLAGIISWGIGCAEANLPGVCTRISKFVPWILENVHAGPTGAGAAAAPPVAVPVAAN